MLVKKKKKIESLEPLEWFHGTVRSFIKHSPERCPFDYILLLTAGRQQRHTARPRFTSCFFKLLIEISSLNSRVQFWGMTNFLKVTACRSWLSCLDYLSHTPHSFGCRVFLCRCTETVLSSTVAIGELTFLSLSVFWWCHTNDCDL